MRVAKFARQLNCFSKIHGYLVWRVSIGRESDRHAHLRGKTDNLRAWINFFAVFAQPGGVQFHGQTMLLDCLQQSVEERR